jgi:hypothetical protein
VKYARPLTPTERRIQRIMAKVDRWCIECMTGENAEWVLAAAILFFVCGTLAMIGR